MGGEEDVVPENLVGCRSMIKGKMGKGKKITFSPHSGLDLRLSSPTLIPGWAGVFSCPYMIKSLKEEVATHSSILAWRIPRTEEPDRL